MDTLSLVSAVVSVTGAFVTVAVGGLFEWRRQRADRENARRDHVSRYRDPLLQAAAGLQGRLYNVLQYLEGKPVTLVAALDTPRQIEYIRYESLYRFAAYQGWVHILFQEAGFLDLGSRRRNRELVRRLAAVNHAIAGHDDGRTGVLLGGEQQLIGELMVVPVESGRAWRRCLGYLEFHTKVTEDADYAERFAPVLDLIDRVAVRSPETYPADHRRLTLVHNALIDLIDFLDPHDVWVMGPRARRPLPEPSPEVVAGASGASSAGASGAAPAE